MKLIRFFAFLLAIMLTISACSAATEEGLENDTEEIKTETEKSAVTEIILSDEEIKINGDKDAVHTANDIIYYEDGHDFTYGEGTEKDSHTKEEADAHTVVHITKAGEYSLSGKLSKGQIAIDLGEDAEEYPEAAVTLILNGVDITCEVAPAVIFYNVYECGSTDTEGATKDVDTSGAGANVIIPDGTVNTVNGSYVERIYKPDSVVLNEEKTEVEDAKKLHKYDGAFYSKMSMNVSGGKEGSGVLNINAENEGLDSELHLTVNGGNINIRSGNDGINTNEDGVSVTTVNGGSLNITVTGETGEGDGIDSNGWLVINGGTVTAAACSNSADAGIDSDMGIHINGGTVIASGSMLDRIEDNGQSYAVFSFTQRQDPKYAVTLKDANGKSLIEYNTDNYYSVLIFSSPELTEGVYTLWSGENQLQGQTGSMMAPGGMMPGGEMPEGFTPPENGERPEPPEGFTIPENGERPEPPEGFTPPENGEPPEPSMNNSVEAGELSSEFEIKNGSNMFMSISTVQKSRSDV